MVVSVEDLHRCVHLKISQSEGRGKESVGPSSAGVPVGCLRMLGKKAGAAARPLRYKQKGFSGYQEQ